MRTRIEQVGEHDPEEIVIRCRQITPEIESMALKIGSTDKHPVLPSFFKGDMQYYLSLAEIVFFETDAERVFAHTVNDSFETRMRLYALEAVLPGNFVRVSRSAIVNIQQVYSIQKGITGVSLIAFRKTHKVIYCSRMYRSNLIRKMEARG
ncbi:MAG TPA: hypothetical protein DCM45_05975 [Clostridiales bacterium]|nr:hypothetical protein [Clostridiales bacterium]